MTRAALLLLVVATAASAKPDPWKDLGALSARVRVGDTAAVAPALAKLAGPPDVKAVAAFLEAKVLARQGDGPGARAAFGRAKAVLAAAAPAYRWLEVEVLRAEGKAADALAATRRFRREWPAFRSAAADLLYSRLMEQAGDPRKAAGVALALYRKSPLALPHDELLAHAARLLKPIDPAESARLRRQLGLSHPESDLAPTDLSLSDGERFQRMELLFRRRSYERCRADALVLWRSGHRRAEVGFYLGKIASERLRDDYPGAEKALREASKAGAPLAEQALASHGIVLAKLGRTAEAVAAFDEWLKRYAASRPVERVVEVHYDRGRALHTGGRSLDAARDLGAFVRTHQKGYDRDKYTWFTGFWTLLGGRPADAIALMKPLLARRNPLVGGKARYWTGVALDRLKRRAEAIRILADLARDMPLTYYAGLAELRLAAWGEALPKRPDLSRVATPKAGAFDGLDNGPEVRRLRLAVALGEPDTSRWVLDAVRVKLAKALGETRMTRLERDLKDDLERFADDRREAYRTQARALGAYPSRGTALAWRAIYPRAYSTHVAHAAAKAGIPEWMVYAHMLQESRYDPTLISGAPAFGLLELLDRTARRLSKDSGEDYQLWMLLEPSHNVRLGARYLGALLKKYGGQLPFAIMAYNGGPMLVDYHLKVSAGLAFDVMIDDLGPHESRNYVRKVIEHFLRYLAIYEAPTRAEEARKALLPAAWRGDPLAEPSY